MAIEFQCPRCGAGLHVPNSAAGDKQRCPKCQGMLRVPLPEFESPRRSEQVSRPESGTTAPARLRPPPRRRAWLAPVVCLLALAGVAAWLVNHSEAKLEGELSGRPLEDIEIGPVRLDDDLLEREEPVVRKVCEHLESDPLHIGSRLFTVEFHGHSSGRLDLFVRAADGAEIHVVDPSQDKRLANYLARHKTGLARARQLILEKSVAKFIKAVDAHRRQAHDPPDLTEFRQSVGLAGLVRGFGLFVVARRGEQTFPCVHEDRQGRLYFVLPREDDDFELTGRDPDRTAGDVSQRFPGRYAVHVAREPIGISDESPKPKPKSRKARKETM